jgi:flavodoxin
LAAYGTVIIGYPNWWGSIPMALFTFFESGDFSGKAILPFCTHEGSGMGRSAADIARLCPKARVLEGLAIRGSGVAAAHASIEKWLRETLSV